MIAHDRSKDGAAINDKIPQASNDHSFDRPSSRRDRDPKYKKKHDKH